MVGGRAVIGGHPIFAGRDVHHCSTKNFSTRNLLKSSYFMMYGWWMCSPWPTSIFCCFDGPQMQQKVAPCWFGALHMTYRSLHPFCWWLAGLVITGGCPLINSMATARPNHTGLSTPICHNMFPCPPTRKVRSGVHLS